MKAWIGVRSCAGRVGQIDIGVFGEREVLAGAMRGDHRGFTDLAHLGVDHAAGIDAGRLLRFGNPGDAVVGREPHDVVVAADSCIEVAEELSQRSIQPHQLVLHFLAVRAEVVAHVVQARKADAEIVDDVALPELKRLDLRCRHRAQIRIRVRAALPQVVELVRRGAGGARERMRKLRRPRRPRALEAGCHPRRCTRRPRASGSRPPRDRDRPGDCSRTPRPREPGRARRPTTWPRRSRRRTRSPPCRHARRA